MFSRRKGENYSSIQTKTIRQEQAELQKEELMKAKVSEENKKIYLIAGAVAVLGSIIVIFKTRKKYNYGKKNERIYDCIKQGS